MNIFNFIFLKKNNRIFDESNNTRIEQYVEMGKLIKEARAQKNLSLKELSDVSKIPESTIYAIENNIFELRPKYPFIRSILYKLEKCLSFKENTLVGLAVRETSTDKKNKSNFLIKEFDFFNSWQGSIFYFLFLILTLFILNRYFISNINILEIQIIEATENEKKVQ